MEFYSVDSLDELPSEPGHYSLAIFGSGFEDRSTYIASTIDRKVAKQTLVLEFENNLDVLSRPGNDRFFADWGIDFRHRSGTDDDKFLYELLDRVMQADPACPFRILVDYSVMTRTWYSALLTWARFARLDRDIEIDFVYASGKYLSSFEPLAISELISLPGFEGTSGGFRRTTAIFGLGYDKYATLAVYDRLEPDSVYCCVAQRFPNDEGSQKALKENSVLVDTAVKVIELPLIDVPAAFRLLADQILGMERSTHIVIVPMGPKTHVLATLLVALRLPWVTCLHARGTRVSPVQVEADGTVGMCRVTFVSNATSRRGE